MTTKAITTLFVSLTVLALMAVPAGAEEITWYTVDGGGTNLSMGGPFTLGGTIGQADADVLSGDAFELRGGFWSGGAVFCYGDFDNDGEVGLSDLAELLANYGEPEGMSYADGDLDGDGDVDLQDLAELLSVYGTICP